MVHAAGEEGDSQTVSDTPNFKFNSFVALHLVYPHGCPLKNSTTVTLTYIDKSGLILNKNFT